jgi:hypothetical protein
MIKQGKRFARVIVGVILIVLGLALSIPGVPGPGIAVIILGLSVLSTEFEFARRWMSQLKNLARRVIRRGDDRSALP